METAGLPAQSKLGEGTWRASLDCQATMSRQSYTDQKQGGPSMASVPHIPSSLAPKQHTDSHQENTCSIRVTPWAVLTAF